MTSRQGWLAVSSSCLHGPLVLMRWVRTYMASVIVPRRSVSVSEPVPTYEHVGRHCMLML